MDTNSHASQKSVALYARVSTVDKGQDPELQLRELRGYALRHQLDIASEYVDRGVSGAKQSRPELNRLMADAEAGNFSVVLVWRFDRFARSASHLLRGLETFTQLGIRFVSLTEGIDTSTLAGKMVFTVLGAVAEMERGIIGERVKAGMKNARLKGIRLGRPSIQANPEVITRHLDGQSARAISRSLDIPLTTVRRQLEAA
jgi:DNA invertase Pin-like site-specific DNA recombinase